VVIEIKCSYDELVPISQIVRNPKNNNRHSIEQIKRLGKILEFQGVRSPLVVSKNSGFLNCGHGRLDALESLGVEMVPVNYQEFKNEAQEYAHMTSDNEIARWAELDWHALHTELENGLEIDPELLGIEKFDMPDCETLDPEDLSDKNKEIDTDNFGNDLEHQCPKCGFEFSE
jgi:hypothetical protein